MEKLLTEIDRMGHNLAASAPETFSRSASELLASTPLHKSFRPDELGAVQERHKSIEKTLDHPCVFSDECFILFHGPGFSIELYHWLYSDTGIHDHNFQGAFQCVSGENHQLEFGFKLKREIFEGLEEGVLTKVNQRVLGPGVTQEIRNKDQFIHTVCHAPSTWNICIRTKAEPNRDLNAYHISGLRYQLRKDVHPDVSADLNDLSSNELLHLFHEPTTKSAEHALIDEILKKRHAISYMSSMEETLNVLNKLGKIAKAY